MKDDMSFCDVCGTQIHEDISFKVYRFVHKESNKPWCDICASRVEENEPRSITELEYLYSEDVDI